MIQDLIKQVLLVEDDMRAILNEAREFAKQIRDNANDEAKVLPQQMREQAQKAAERRITEAKARNAKLHDSLLAEATAKADELERIAEANIPSAVSFVVGQVTRTPED